jgi:hypothetical protein
MCAGRCTTHTPNTDRYSTIDTPQHSQLLLLHFLQPEKPERSAHGTQAVSTPTARCAQTQSHTPYRVAPNGRLWHTGHVNHPTTGHRHPSHMNTAPSPCKVPAQQTATAAASKPGPWKPDKSPQHALLSHDYVHEYFFGFFWHVSLSLQEALQQTRTRLLAAQSNSPCRSSSAGWL